MPALLVHPDDVSGGELVLRDDEAHHLQVRRHQIGDEVDVIDGQGQYYRVRLEEIGRREARAMVLAAEIDRGESALRLHLAAALIKGQRLDYAIEKATEVGVATITPMATARAVVRPGSSSRQRRWQRVAQAAAKQSGRSRVPTVRPVGDFESVLGELTATCDGVVMGDLGAGQSLGKALAAPAVHLGLLVGPEGGFTADEVDRARAAGVITFAWGASTLRSDTAAVVLSALVLEAADRLAAA